MASGGARQAAAIADEFARRVRGLPVRRVPQLRSVRRDFSARLRDAPPALVLAVAGALLRRDDVVPRGITYELVHQHPAALGSLGEAELEELARGLEGWGPVDAFAGYLAGPAWREGQVDDDLIHRWARSPDRWRRRLALVCTVPLNKRSSGGSGDTPRTLEVCRRLVDDRDDMVVKALSWALRELAKRDRSAVESFLAELGTRVPARARREVRNKLDTGRKNPRRGERARRPGPGGASGRSPSRPPEETET